MAQQLALYRRPARPTTEPVRPPVPTRRARPVCAGCRAKEARYGFRTAEDAGFADRPRTLCFDCFRMELSYRQTVASQLARGWNGDQASLPLGETLHRVDLQRRRAQIVARHALGI